MPRSRAKSGKTRTPEMQSYLFEIKQWKPEYSWSINQDKVRDVPYREYLTLELHTTCIFPKKLVPREALFVLMADRDRINPTVFQHDPDWTPRCVGLLTLRPNGGHFYMGLPHENFATMLAALAHGLFRFVDVYGPVLSYGKSECSSFRFVRSVNLEDY